MKLGIFEKSSRFYVKHPRAAKNISLVVLVLAVFGLLYLDVPPWLAVLLLLLFSFSRFFVIANAGNTLASPAVKQMIHQGDPEPLLKISEELLSYPAAPANRQVYLINYCAALDNVGEHDKAYELLREINIDEKTTHPANKLVYYNNLAGLRMSMGVNDESVENYQKALKVFEDIKNEKWRKAVAPTANHVRAYLAYFEGEYHSCLALLQTPMPTLTGRVDQAFLRARVAIAQGDLQTAKEKLHEVIEKGNKLYCVTEAKELLKTLE
jgi:tetratricopeptide (TPR) repeat protein